MTIKDRKEIERLQANLDACSTNTKILTANLYIAVAERDALQRELNDARRWARAWKAAAKYFWKEIRKVRNAFNYAQNMSFALIESNQKLQSRINAMLAKMEADRLYGRYTDE